MKTIKIIIIIINNYQFLFNNNWKEDVSFCFKKFFFLQELIDAPLRCGATHDCSVRSIILRNKKLFPKKKKIRTHIQTHICSIFLFKLFDWCTVFCCWCCDVTRFQHLVLVDLVHFFFSFWCWCGAVLEKVSAKEAAATC